MFRWRIGWEEEKLGQRTDHRIPERNQRTGSLADESIIGKNYATSTMSMR